MSPLSDAATGAIVIDASVAIAICAKENTRAPKAVAELQRYSTAGYDFYAPGAIVAETLYVLCGKLHQGKVTAAQHAQAILDFAILMSNVLSPPRGEGALVTRAEAIRSGYGCSRSADGIYIALAEELTKSIPTVLLTFDEDMHKQAARHAPTVKVNTIA